MRNKIIIGILVFAVFAYFSLQTISPATVAQSQHNKNDSLIESTLAYHIGVLAYLYGYPLVDLHKQMHNETHKTGHEEQRAAAAVNRLYKTHEAAKAASQQQRGIDSNMLTFSGWFDISKQPLIVHVPDTAKRYYNIAITDMYSEVTHIGRRATGSKEAYFALTLTDWQGQLPDNVQRLTVTSSTGWLNGQVHIANGSDIQKAQQIINDVWLAQLDEFNGAKPAARAIPKGEFIDPSQELEFFSVLQKVLRNNPNQITEQALINQFNLIGIGPKSPDFDPASLSQDTHSGLVAAIKEARKLILASTQRTLKTNNGWMTQAGIGHYPSDDYMTRASIAKGGYGNTPQESVSLTRIFDNDGMLLNGGNHYKLSFSADMLPPVNDLWSLSVYDLNGVQLVDNVIDRYSIGNKTDNLVFDGDGSLHIRLQHEQPKDSNQNWLPIPNDDFILVARLYEPNAATLNTKYTLPSIELLP